MASQQAMRYRTLGQTGLRVSNISLGCAPLGNVYGDLDLDKSKVTTLFPSTTFTIERRSLRKHLKPTAEHTAIFAASKKNVLP